MRTHLLCLAAFIGLASLALSAAWGVSMHVGTGRALLGGKQAAAPVIPDINFNFATQTYQGGVTPQAVMPVVRSTTGYAKTAAGTLQSFGPNVLRITTLGLLIESSVTNQVIQSQQFAGTGWTQSNTVSTDNQVTAPDGTMTAATLADNAANASHFIFNAATPSFTNTNSYIGSCYVRAGTDTRVQLTFDNTNGVFSGFGYADFDLSTGIVSTTGGTLIGAGIEAYGAQPDSPALWYRVFLNEAATATATGGGMLVVRINSGVASRAPSYVGTGTAIDVWGCQFEQIGIRPSSYFPTTTVAATRSSDVIAGVTGKLKTLLETSSGVASFKTKTLVNTFTNVFLGVGPAGVIGLGKNNTAHLTSTWAATVTSGTTEDFTGELTSSVAWNSNGIGLWSNGGIVPIGSASTVSAITTESIGSTGAGGSFLNGYLEQMIVSPTTGTAGTNPMALAVYNNPVFVSDFTVDGLSSIDLNNTHNPGYKWYLNGAFPNAAVTSYTTQVTQIASYITLNGSNGITINQTNNGIKALTTVADNGSGGLVGTTFTSGYIQCVYSFDVTLATVGGAWPTCWTKGSIFIVDPSATVNTELDLGEAFPTGNGTISFLMGIHDQGISGGAFVSDNQNTSNQAVSIGSPTFNNATFHTYGTIEILPADNNGVGVIQRFFDGAHLSAADITCTATAGANPAASPSNPAGTYCGNGSTNPGLSGQPRWLILASGSASSPQWPTNFKSMIVNQFQNFLLTRDLDPASNDNSPVFLNMVG